MAPPMQERWADRRDAHSSTDTESEPSISSRPQSASGRGAAPAPPQLPPTLSSPVEVLQEEDAEEPLEADDLKDTVLRVNSRNRLSPETRPSRVRGTKESNFSDGGTKRGKAALKEMRDDAQAEKNREEEEIDRGEVLEENIGMRVASMKKAGKGYDISNFSWFRRKCHDLVVWNGFDTAIGVVIMVNGMTIGIQAQASAKIPLGCNSRCGCKIPNTVCFEVPAWIDILEWFFLVVYCIELSLRFYVFRLPVLRSNWVRLDCFLVLSAIVDVVLAQVQFENEYLQQLMLVRMFRLARLARAVRLLVTFQTLWMLVQGLMHSILTLFWTFVMILTLIFIFAVLGMELIQVDLSLPTDHPYNIAAMNFRTLLDSSLILLQCFCWDSISSVYRPLIKHRLHLFLYFMGVQLVLAIALMNLVTAIMVEGSLAQADEDKEAKKAYASAKRKKQMERLRDMFLELDEDGSGELTMEEIDNAPPSIRAQLVEIAGTEDIGSLFEMLDYDGSGTVGTDEFCDGVIKAANGVTPVEMSRLIKQNTDILHNSRQVIAMLRGEEYEAGSNSGGSGGEDEDAPKPKQLRRHSSVQMQVIAEITSQFQQNQKSAEDRNAAKERLQGLEERVDNMERNISSMKMDVQNMVAAMTKLSTMSFGSHKNVKRAVALCVGPAGNRSMTALANHSTSSNALHNRTF